MRNRLALLAVAAIATAFIYPALAPAANLDRAALALALAGPAAGAALAMAAGRPPLMATALAGAAAYVSAALSLRGVPVLASIAIGTLAGAALGAAAAALSARLDATAFLIATLLLALAGAAAVQALPDITGAQAGLGPLQGVSVALGAAKTAVLTPLGDFHLMLAVGVLSGAGAALLLASHVGARWRAIGSDQARAAASGLRPVAGQIAVLATAGALAGLSGALGAHIARVATPQAFAADAAALPLLAAFAAGRQPLGAALVAIAIGVVGGLVLPAAGWQGPPDAMSLATGLLAVAALFTLLPGGAARGRERDLSIDPGKPWPLEAMAGARLDVAPTQVRAPSGELLLDSPALSAEPGSITAVVGPNGAGKTTLLRELSGRRLASGERVVLLPQEGGGFATCTVRETLELAARRGRSRDSARAAASAWLERLAMAPVAGVMCGDLSSGPRRLLDLARVLLAAPSVLLCDEPLAGLDDAHRAAAVSCLRAAAGAGLTVVLAEHDREAVAAMAARVVTLERPGWAPAAPAAAEAML
ncbi:MAG: ATP-binding cassette domain-containing protein [Candidatus Dormibacteraeota bacterium]|nr:ATP-binding cassette domain-containing protein [Candidatus Dormibacteraeota bacterium]MBV9524430.1 ATP-binding cassette domain-containing protein [Candidatus Dormibacteraeota bacterium]